jgi:flagellar motor switch protein FliG
MIGNAFNDRGINVFRPVYEEIEAEYEKAAAEKNLLKAMYVPDPDFSDLKVLCSLDEVTVQKIVEENLDSIAKAVAFADDEIQQKIFTSVSPETVLKIKKEIEELKKPVLESQEKILNSLRAKVRNVSGNTVVFDA